MQGENVTLGCLLSVAQLFQDRLGAIHSCPLLWSTSLHKRNLVPVLVPFFGGLQHFFGILCKNPQTVRDFHQAHAITQVCDNYFRDVQELKLLNEVAVHLQHDVDRVVDRL